MSWPSISITCQPKARHLSAIGSIGITWLDGAVDLAVVVVEDHAEVGELELGRRHRGFPDLAFLDLAVADHAVDARRSCHRA